MTQALIDDGPRVTIVIETESGESYVFPDTSWKILGPILKSDCLLQLPVLSLINRSRANLMIPTSIIMRILADGEERWTRR